MKKLLYLQILLIFQYSVSQDFRFGKVSKEELVETTHAIFPEANAAILYKNQDIRFSYVQDVGFRQENEIFQRIKIYNKEGFDYATKLIRLFVNSQGPSSNNEEIIGLKAVTYTLVNGKIEADKLKKEGVFEEETNKFWKTIKFTMPNIQEGCIIEFEYTIQSQLTGIDDIEFQQMIPINKLDFRLKTPEYFQYKKLLNPRAIYTPKLSTSTVNESFSITTKERPQSQIPGFRGTGNATFTSSEVKFKSDVISSNLIDIPPLKNEEYVDNLSNYQAKLIMELDFIKYPNETSKSFSTNWEQVTKIIYDDQDFGAQLNKKGYFDDDLDQLLTGISDPVQKASLIFNHVKSKVKWNDYHGYMCDLGVSKAYKSGEGNSADINLMLISMLSYAGLEAHPILVSTKNNGIPLLPTRTGFNYVICGVVIDSNTFLLDATQKFTTANILPVKSLNWLGRLIRDDKTSEWVELTPVSPSKETVSLNVKLKSDLSAEGKVRAHYTEYQAFSMRNRYENVSNQQIIERLEKDKGELRVSNLEIDKLYDVTQPITQTYEFSVQNAMEDIGGKLYFSPLFFLSPKESPFREDNRNYPIDFVYPISDKYMVNIMLPEGYVIDTLPGNSKMEFNSTEGAFSYLARENGSMLQITISMDLNKAVILAKDYEQFKQFYQFMIEKQTEKVVLKKV
ncbi:MAG: DUF3857 domain-containing protein [Aquaticitalea sp.]